MEGEKCHVSSKIPPPCIVLSPFSKAPGVWFLLHSIRKTHLFVNHLPLFSGCEGGGAGRARGLAGWGWGLIEPSLVSPVSVVVVKYTSAYSWNDSL